MISSYQYSMISSQRLVVQIVMYESWWLDEKAEAKTSQRLEK